MALLHWRFLVSGSRFKSSGMILFDYPEFPGVGTGAGWGDKQILCIHFISVGPKT